MKSKAIEEEQRTNGAEMKKRSFSAVLLLVLSLSIMFVTLFLSSVKADSNTINVPEDYPTIQEAVNAASLGDIILVASGTYQGNIVINKSLTLRGAGDSTTFINGNSEGAGIEITADNVTISGFTILDCKNGIKITNNGNTVIDSTVTSNIFAGIYVEFADGNTVSNNTLVSNDFGVYLEVSSKNKISGNAITNNSDTGILVRDQSGNNLVNNNTIASNSFYGVNLYNSGNALVSGNMISNNNAGIGLIDSSGNVITDNTISSNKYYGIDLFGSNSNVITGNTISNNEYCGIDLFESSNSTIYHNNLVDNQYQAESYETTNTWDNGAEGNYWSDYTGEDLNGDGIGDTPYQGIDNYPLKDPWTPVRVFNVVLDQETHIVTIHSNSTIASFNFNQSLEQIGFNITGPSDTLGFCNVTIPKNLLNSEPPKSWIVTVDGTYVSFTLTENSTHSSLQFTLSHSIRRVQIRVIGIQNVPPQADFTFSPIDPTLYDTIDFTDNSTDSDGEIASWLWRFGDGNSSTDQNPGYKYANAGKYAVTLTVEDDLGATTVTAKAVSVRKVGTSLTLDAPSTVTRGEPFKMTAILEDEFENSLTHATIEFYQFEVEEWENIGSAETNDDGVASITYVSPQVNGTQRFMALFPGTQIFAGSSGIYKIEILVIVDVDLPEADAGPDQRVRVGASVVFNASGSSDNVGIVSYEWDFGDGATGAGVIATHTYTEPGAYTVTLTVKDEGGNSDTDTVKVIVEAESSFNMWIVGIIVAAGIISLAGLFIYARARIRNGLFGKFAKKIRSIRGITHTRKEVVCCLADG